jgi:hypothetical protein
MVLELVWEVGRRCAQNVHRQLLHLAETSVIYTTRRRCHIICPKHLQLNKDTVQNMGKPRAVFWKDRGVYV